MFRSINKCILILIFIIVSALLHGQNKINDLYYLSLKQFNEGKYVEALGSNIKALKFAEETKNCSQIAYAHIQVGKMHYYLKDKRQTLKSLFVAKRLVDSCGIDSLKHKVLHNIGAMYTELKKTDSALFYLNSALSYLKKTNNYVALSRGNAVIADLYTNVTGNISEAEKYIMEADKCAKLSKDTLCIAFVETKRGGLAFIKKDYAEALKRYKLAYSIYNKVGYVEGKLAMTKSMADVSILSGEREAALATMNLHLNIKDSIFKKETANKIAEYKTLYETEKKEAENKQLLQEKKTNEAMIGSRNKTIIILVSSILVMIALVGWRININNLKKKQRAMEALQAMQKERERISRDLHDNVGGQLSYVLYSIDNIVEEDKAKQIEAVKNINESVRNVISNLRETIWTISDEELSMSVFSDKLKVYVRTMFRNTETKILFTEKLDEEVALNASLGLNLYRICQEIINNVFKHAKATKLEISIEAEKGIVIMIRDNGVGFVPGDVPIDSFGLTNIKNRAKEINIQLNFETELSVGTTYKLLV